MTERLSRPGVDLLLELAEHNAPRRCQRCDQQAEYYILTRDVLSEFVCGDDLEGAIERAQAQEKVASSSKTVNRKEVKTVG